MEEKPLLYILDTLGALCYCLLSWTNFYWCFTIRDGQEQYLVLTLAVLSVQCREENWLSLWFQNQSCQ